MNMSSERLTLQEINDRLDRVRTVLRFVNEDELGKAMKYSRTQLYKIRSGQSRTTPRFLRALQSLEELTGESTAGRIAEGKETYGSDALRIKLLHEVGFIEDFGSPEERASLRALAARLYKEATGRLNSKSPKKG